MPPDLNLWVPALLATLLAGAALFAALRRPPKTWTVCPESERPALVEARANVVVDCSLWPKHGDCVAPCRATVAQGGTPLETVLTRWYERESCFICGQPLSRMTRPTDPLALAAPDGTTDEWNEVENLPEALAEYEPVCWQCHVARSREERSPNTPSTRAYRKSGDS